MRYLLWASASDRNAAKVRPAAFFARTFCQGAATMALVSVVFEAISPLAGVFPSARIRVLYIVWGGLFLASWRWWAARRS